MSAYSHLLDEERDRIAVVKAAGRSISPSPGRFNSEIHVSQELRRNACRAALLAAFRAAGAYATAQSGVKPCSKRSQAEELRLRSSCGRMDAEQYSGWLKAGTNTVRAVGWRRSPSCTAPTERRTTLALL